MSAVADAMAAAQARKEEHGGPAAYFRAAGIDYDELLERVLEMNAVMVARQVPGHDPGSPDGKHLTSMLAAAALRGVAVGMILQQQREER